jgi:hypothetical protein
MRRSGLAMVMGLMFLCALPAIARAQFLPAVAVSAEAAGVAYQQSRYQAALSLDVLPLDAEVLLDGKSIGTARQLVAVAVPVTPGWHTVEVVAPGHHSYAGRFVADQHSSASMFVVNLVPIR